MKQPDPYLHQKISFAKSALRIIAGSMLWFANISLVVSLAGIFLILAELLGIIEELV
jgi:hypothetical protein